jgi:hypothetical protein
MTRVIFTPQVRHYFKELIPILYRGGYFSHLEGSRKYVNELIGNIHANLPHLQSRPAPPYFNKYGTGMYYATFRKNRDTVWYAFFTRYDDGGDTVFLVRHIDNNHTVAQHL